VDRDGVNYTGSNITQKFLFDEEQHEQLVVNNDIKKIFILA